MMSAENAPPNDYSRYEVGEEPNLFLRECVRCDEPRKHYFEVEAEFPLVLLVSYTCGECSSVIQEWESVPIQWVQPGIEQGASTEMEAENEAAGEENGAK